MEAETLTLAVLLAPLTSEAGIPALLGKETGLLALLGDFWQDRALVKVKFLRTEQMRYSQKVSWKPPMGPGVSLGILDTASFKLIFCQTPPF